VHTVKLDPYGFAIVRVYIRPKNTHAMLHTDYKVDTGANCTTIGIRRLIDLGYDKEWVKSGRLLSDKERPILASGLPVDDCYEIVLPEITIGSWVGYNWRAITSLSVPFKFLLGTDSLQFFNWNFDYENGNCNFDLIHGKRRLLFNQEQQSIHSIDEVDKC
jgi:hypothetical protein